MNRGTAIGESGLRSMQAWVDTIAHNVANSNTPGYRRHVIGFEAALASALAQGELPVLLQGGGLGSTDTVIDHQQGMLEQTGRQLDLALEGHGFFVVRDTKGDEWYTRDGTFYADGSGTLTTADGLRVVGTDGEPISLGTAAGDVEIDQDGRVTAPGSETASVQLQLVVFDNPERLRPAGSQRYRQSAASGPPRTFVEEGVTSLRVRQGYREQSNVSLATELTNLVVAERAYQLAARLVSEGDRLDALAGDLST